LTSSTKYKATPTYPNRLPLPHHLATSRNSSNYKKKKKKEIKEEALRFGESKLQKTIQGFSPKNYDFYAFMQVFYSARVCTREKVQDGQLIKA
jgi:hypothetical protein